MKLVVVGFGQCGSKVADVADLSSLSSVKSGYRHRILIGNRKTGSHGVGKINEVGAEIARHDGDKVIDALRSAERFYEAIPSYLLPERLVAPVLAQCQ